MGQVVKSQYVEARGTGSKDYEAKLDVNASVNIRNLDSEDVAHVPLPYEQITFSKSFSYTGEASIPNHKLASAEISDSDDWGSGKTFYLTGFILVVNSNSAIMNSNLEGVNLRISEYDGTNYEYFFRKSYSYPNYSPVYSDEEEPLTIFEITEYFALPIKITNTEQMLATLINRTGGTIGTGDVCTISYVGYAI